MSESERCPSCGMPVPRARSTCPICGHNLAASRALQSETEEPAPIAVSSEDPQGGADEHAIAVLAPPDVADDPGRGGNPRPGLVITLLGLLIVVILGAGTAVAFTVPVVSVKADRPLDRLLPASTVMYLSLDVNPAGATKRRLRRLTSAFTGQPAWKSLEATLNGGTHSSASTGTCYDQTRGQAFQHLDWLGHESAIALIGTSGLSSTSGTAAAMMSGGAKRNLLMVAPLQMNETLAGALSGFHLSLPSAELTYGGTTIYTETFPSCRQASNGVASLVYGALVHGYVLLSLDPQPIERIIDTAAGKAAVLASSNSYRRLVAALPPNRLASYYVNGAALGAVGLDNVTHVVPIGNFVSSSAVTAPMPSSAGALTVEAGGFRMTAVSESKPSASIGPSVPGTLAKVLPDTTLAFVSIGDFAGDIRRTVASLKGNGALSGEAAQTADALVNDLTGSMAGEADIVLFHPQRAINVNFAGPQFNLPVALMWRVTDDFQAAEGLQRVLQTAHLTTQFTLKSTAAADYEVTTGGYGYTVTNGWAMVSPAIAQTASDFSVTPVTPLASSPRFTSTETPGSTPSALWYIDLAGLRSQVEGSLQASGSNGDAQLYRQNVQPLLAPLTILSGSTTAEAGGTLQRSTVFLGVK